MVTGSTSLLKLLPRSLPGPKIVSFDIDAFDIRLCHQMLLFPLNHQQDGYPGSHTTVYLLGLTVVALRMTMMNETVYMYPVARL